MKNALTLILLICIVCSNAQTKKDSLIIRKNDLQLNVLPYLKAINAFGANSDLPSGHLIYKRHLKDKWYGRVSVAVFSKQDFLGKNSPVQTNKVKSIGNSMLGIEYTNKTIPTNFEPSIGIERRWGKGRVKQFYGIDVRYRNKKYDIKEMYAIRDSLSSEGFYNYSKEGKSLFEKDSIVSYRKQNTNTFSVNPFYGVRINVTKRWFISAQVGLDLQLAFETLQVVNNNITNKLYTTKFTNIGVNHTAVSNNICIGFNF